MSYHSVACIVYESISDLFWNVPEYDLVFLVTFCGSLYLLLRDVILDEFHFLFAGVISRI